jgi:lysophospholipase L1-like esterase
MSPRPAAWLVAALIALACAPAVSSAATRDLYVALGDSYTTGYQPTGQGVGHNTRNGFAFQLVPLARQRGYKGLKLVNFGCGGATTVSLLNTKSCKPASRAPGGIDYTGRTQMAAAEAYLKKNRARIAFVTVLIGGNDVTRCAKEADPVPCVGTAAGAIKKNVTTIGRRVRKAIGAGVPIVGGTYPDVILGQWVSGVKADQDLAALSTIAFKSIVNPALLESYGRSDIKFVDVTAATGAYGPLDQLTTIAPYGQVPVPVATICEISFYCVYRDIHLRTNGYRQVAELFADELPRRTKARALR